MMIEPAPLELSRTAFIATFGGIYEHSSWVAETLYDQGINQNDSDPVKLAIRMAEIVDAVGAERKMALLCSHPELAGKLAVSGSLTAESTAEQASAQLDQCSAKEFAEFQTLNQRYHETFSHPFIIAVRGLDRTEILAAFRKRVNHTAPIEFHTALAEVHKIAKLRLKQLDTRSS
jgi:OHCU decarboxylase